MNRKQIERNAQSLYDLQQEEKNRCFRCKNDYQCESCRLEEVKDNGYVIFCLFIFITIVCFLWVVYR